MITICKVCGAVESLVSNGDADGCSECYSIEQGFLFTERFSDGLVVDEDGLIYIEDEELDGAVACEL